mmetsp:Transcript_17404/g.28301  ORF Transcript_17404/g.28301 Transcript_17404/m.28301 type:complete len:248 (+) Transcript_17404:56-799(+)
MNMEGLCNTVAEKNILPKAVASTSLSVSFIKRALRARLPSSLKRSSTKVHADADSTTSKFQKTDAGADHQRRKELNLLLETILELARKACITSDAYFIEQAVAFRHSSISDTKNRAAHFKYITEEFIATSAPLHLQYISAGAKHALITQYFLLPVRFSTDTPSRKKVEEYINNCTQGSRQTLTDAYADAEHVPAEVFDETIVEAMNFIHAAFEQERLPVDCLHRLYHLVFGEGERTHHPSSIIRQNV